MKVKRENARHNCQQEQQTAHNVNLRAFAKIVPPMIEIFYLIMSVFTLLKDALGKVESEMNEAVGKTAARKASDAGESKLV
jgi:hypothetical protein